MRREEIPVVFSSADGHVIEPDDLYRDRLPRVYRDRAPAYEYSEGLIKWYDRFGRLKQWASPMFDVFGNRLTDSVSQRIASLDAQKINVEVLYPNNFEMLREEDPTFAVAMAKVYNDYMFEAYGEYPDRFVPVSTIPVADVKLAVQELERTAAMGARSIAIPEMPTVPYWSPDYEPLWSAAEEAKLVVAFHIGTAVADGSFKPMGVGGGRRVIPPGEALTVSEALRCGTGVQISYPAQEVIAHLVGSGVLDRHPNLHFVAAEYHAHWLAGFMSGIDKAWTLGLGQPDTHLMGDFDPTRPVDDQPGMVNIFHFNTRWRYPLRPSEYVRRQIHCTFMDDPGAIGMRHITGVEALLWGADFPHPEGTSPETNPAIQKQLAGVPVDDLELITGGNLRRLYGLTN